MMEYLPITLIIAIAIFFWILLSSRKPKSKQERTAQKTGFEYDSEGYNREGYDREGYNRLGYNEVGRNKQRQYNRYYNVKCYKANLYSEEGFLDIRKNQLYLTNHARERMKERMGIVEYDKMDDLAFEAYQFGKSKLQIMKSERYIIEEKEKEYDGSVILIYRGYCYVFTENNGLKTVYKNDRIRA